MSSSSTWLSADELAATCDEDETVRKRWQQLRIYVDFAGLSVNDHGLGHGTEWIAKYKSRDALLPILSKDDFNDRDFSSYLLYLFNAYNNKEDVGTKGTLRHAHSWGSYMCRMHGKGAELKLSTFTLTNGLWKSIWKKIKAEKSEYAPGTTDDDEKKLREWRVIIPDTLGRPEGPEVPDIDAVKRKYLWSLRQAMGNRKTVIHEMKVGDIIIDIQFVPDPNRPSLMLTTPKTKHDGKENSHLGPCQCFDKDEKPVAHIKYSDLCRVGLGQLYHRDCSISDEYLKSDICRNTAKDKSWYWRRTANKPKPYQNEKYHSWQRWGKDTNYYGMAHNLRFLNDKPILTLQEIQQKQNLRVI